MLIQVICVLVAGLFMAIAAVNIIVMKATGGMLPGGIINSLMVIGLQVSLKQSISLTYIFLTGGGLASTMISFFRKNAEGRRLIDYDLMILTMPMMMSGVIFGAMIKNALSQLILLITFIIIIFYIFVTATKKIKQIQRLQQLGLSRIVTGLSRIERSKTFIKNPRLKQILEQENSLFPLEKLKIIGLTYAYTVLILFMKGGRNFQSIIGLKSCSYQTWAMLLLHIIISIILDEAITQKRMELEEEKQSLGFIFTQGEKMTGGRLYKSMLQGFFAGAMSASFSVGADMLLVPVWYEMGIQRNTALATSGPLVFMAGSLSFLISFLLGRYDSYTQVLYYFATSFIWVYLMRKLLIFFIERYKLKKMVFYLLRLMMVASFFIIIAMQYHIFYEKPERFFMFEGVC